jgi:hypothetical protein
LINAFYRGRAMTKILIAFKLFFLISLTVQAKSKIHDFEGSINLKKETVYDTSFVTIQVKGNQVRLDEFDSKKNLISILIINLDNEKVLALSPKQKLFYEFKSNRAIQSPHEDTVVIKTENRMVLDGYSCCQMRVKSVSHDSETAFWVTPKNFVFFISMNKILRNIKSDINLFTYFPNTSGVFPMLTVERTLLRKEKMKVMVTGIKEVVLSENLFKIPLGYQMIEH